MTASDNPFATRHLEALPFQPQGTTWDALRARWEKLHRRAAICGPKGSGKTTLCHELAALWKSQNHRVRTIHLSEDIRRLSGETWRKPARNEIIILDGAEQLSPPAWLIFRWKMRNALGLLITQHNRGRLPTLLETTTSPALLADLAQQLAPRIDIPDNLFSKHQGNLREALLELYDSASHRNSLNHPSRFAAS